LEESINGVSTGGDRKPAAASSPVRLTPEIPSQTRPSHILKVDSTTTHPSKPMTPNPVSIVTSGEGLKLCPAQKAAGKEVEMLPCELYGIDVDVSQAGIWFDGGHENELVSVLEKIDKKSAKNVMGIFRGKSWENQLNAKITKAREKHAEYQRIITEWEGMEDKRFAAEGKLLRSPNDASALEERRLVIEQFREVATKERALRVEAKLNITPGQIEKEIRLEPYGSPGEGPKGCPTNPKVNMVKIKIHDDVLDISDTGIWFDQGELVRLLESFENKGGGFAGFLTNYSKHKNTILDAIQQKKKNVGRHTEVYQEFRELIQRAKRHSKSSDEYKRLKAESDVKYAEYVKLSIELDRIEDLTPKLSLGGILGGN
jgi:Zn-finger nucleic acid-binding protein